VKRSIPEQSIGTRAITMLVSSRIASYFRLPFTMGQLLHNIRKSTNSPFRISRGQVPSWHDNQSLAILTIFTSFVIRALALQYGCHLGGRSGPSK